MGLHSWTRPHAQRPNRDPFPPAHRPAYDRSRAVSDRLRPHIQIPRSQSSRAQNRQALHPHLCHLLSHLCILHQMVHLPANEVVLLSGSSDGALDRLRRSHDDRQPLRVAMETGQNSEHRDRHSECGNSVHNHNGKLSIATSGVRLFASDRGCSLYRNTPLHHLLDYQVSQIRRQQIQGRRSPRAAGT